MVTIRPWLCIGGLRETHNPRLLAAEGIGAMLQLAERVEQKGIEILYLPTEDGRVLAPERIRLGVDFVRAQKDADRITLVACGLGISRASTFGIAAIKEIEEISLRDALQAVLARHPTASPNPALWQSLCDYYQEPIPYTELLRRRPSPGE